MSVKIKLGINGFGRIGRSLARIALSRPDQFELVAINDLDDDIRNHAYLLQYDSTYGRFNQTINSRESYIDCETASIRFFSFASILDVPWHDLSVDILIDSSGVSSNVLASSQLIKSNRVKKVLVTHSPSNGVDFTLMLNVNDNLYDREAHNVISTSICDVVGLAPFYSLINNSFGIESGHITTLHPWLQYQNLLDGTIKSVSNPGHFWKDYSLGRSSIGNLIPKETTVIPALDKVIPGSSSRLHAMSYRIPTSSVTSSEGSFVLAQDVEYDSVLEILTSYANSFSRSMQLCTEQLVSSDFQQLEVSCIVDVRWLHITNNRLLRFMLWYDNEWGYSSRVLDSALFVSTFF